MTTETALVPTTQVGLQNHRLEFSAAQRQLIRDTCANGATEEEFAPLIEMAQARGLNPLLRQVFFVKRWDQSKGREVWQVQISIDGLRAVAQRTGFYGGQDEPQFEYDSDGLVVLARVKVYRKDVTRPFVGIAHYKEFVQRKKDGTPVKMWIEKPHIMTAKCAESGALRRGFPEDTSGLYIPEEREGESEPQSLAPKVFTPTQTDDEVIERWTTEILNTAAIGELEAIAQSLAGVPLSEAARSEIGRIYLQQRQRHQKQVAA